MPNHWSAEDSTETDSSPLFIRSPTMVGDLMNRGELSVSVLSSADQWFGMTYHEDHPRVAAALQKLHDAGVYPDKLA